MAHWVNNSNTCTVTYVIRKKKKPKKAGEGSNATGLKGYTGGHATTAKMIKR